MGIDINDEDFQYYSEIVDDEDWEDDNEFDDEGYMFGMTLPKQKFIGTSKREFHIRIKLNNAPVNIWRELVVPSNITLELLAFVLIDAMGWRHEHLYHFRGKDNVFYVNSQQLKEQEDFLGFCSRHGWCIEEQGSDRSWHSRRALWLRHRYLSRVCHRPPAFMDMIVTIPIPPAHVAG